MPRVLAFVGCLNRPAPYFQEVRGHGIAVLAFDADNGAFTPLAQTDGIDNPTFVVPAPGAAAVYATSEVFGWLEGTVTAYRADPATGRLTYVNKQPTQGSITAQASLHPSGQWLFVANYRIGADGLRPPRAVIALPIEADGGLGPVASGLVHAGATGPDAARQEGPHPHCAVPSPDGRFVLVADLGLDRIFVHAFDAASGRLSEAGSLALPPGTGPRHLAFTPDGRHVTATGELDCTLHSLAWTDGGLAPVDRASLLPPGAAGDSHAADIAVSPDGRHVYASVRGHDSIAAFGLDARGHLSPLGHTPTGPTPRSFTLDPTGLFLIVAAQNGHVLDVWHRDPASGQLRDHASRFALGSPMCVRMVTV